MGITNGQAQKMASLYEAHMAKMSESHQKAAARALNDYVAEQNKAISARPGFKEDVRLATVATRMFGSDELNRVFSETAIGSHPAMFDLMVKVGRMAEKMKAEPGFEGRSAAAPERPLHERMWPNGGVGFTK